ncbi:hypothetical protein BDK51DRAFT_49648 [Blyttiomyces helicus]|uniref:Uncharacterized protein n=1 Tax=Blyttiomyces helicus TaxID=388810 RepID=A0A4V1IPE1_9FUNG|nr:hypothetical protein BDK51DRAFT_49648 [Blyttiomyces helicus]|eukprot:RKO82737.1 hypothetical protein BDK51DRAFT_49648 [Blyttiomyces helicus]
MVVGAVKKWGGRRPGRLKTTILRYLLNSLDEHENDYSDRLNPSLDQQDWRFFMGSSSSVNACDGEAGAYAGGVSATLHSLAKEVASLRAQVVDLSETVSIYKEKSLRRHFQR